MLGSTEHYPAIETKQLGGTNSKKTLVLDLDETLVHCRMLPFDNVCAAATFFAGTQMHCIYISKRNGLEDFLASVSKYYTLVLYTASVKEYADAVLKTLKIDRFFHRIYHRDHCKLNQENKFIKNLSVVGVPFSNVILLDDSPAHIQNQPDNILMIKPFQGSNKEDDDEELPMMAEFLIKTAEKVDVRPVMDAFVSFAVDNETTSYKKESVRPLERGFRPKFMQKLKHVSKKQTACQSIDGDEEWRLDDLYEKESAQQVPATRSRKDSFAMRKGKDATAINN